MFGLFKSRLAPAGPVQINGEVEIDKPVEEVFAMIDWADPRNAKRATGNIVRGVPGKPDQFEMVMPAMDDLLFRFIVTENLPGRRYAFGCVIEPPIGKLAHNHERYDFEPLGADRCRVALVTEVTFVEGLRERDFANEVGMMAASVQSALQKLKLQAELGAQVAKAIEQNTLI